LGGWQVLADFAVALEDFFGGEFGGALEEVGVVEHGEDVFGDL